MVTAYVSPTAPFDVIFLNRLIYPWLYHIEGYWITSCATLLNPPNSVYYDSLSIKIPVFGRPSASGETHYSFFVFTPCSISEEAIEGLWPPLRFIILWWRAQCGLHYFPIPLLEDLGVLQNVSRLTNIVVIEHSARVPLSAQKHRSQEARQPLPGWQIAEL